MANVVQFLQHIRDLIARDDLPAALGILRGLLENTPQLNDILQHSGRLASIRREYNLGQMTQEAAATAQNRVRFAVLELLSDLEGQGATASPLRDLLAAVEQESARPEVKSELEQAISINNSKNVLVASQISAGGNVHIGDINTTIVYGTPAPGVAPALARPLNEHLTKHLIQAIQPHSVAAGRFLEKAQNIPQWESHPQAGNKAKEILAYSMVGTLGIQLSKLFAIGKEDFSENVGLKYLEKCLHIARHSLDLLVFALMSQLWEAQKRQSRTFNAAQTKALSDFFDRPFEPSLLEQVALLDTLHGLFAEHGLAFPLPEWDRFAPQCRPDNAFYTAVSALQQLDGRLNKKQVGPEDCLAAEQALGDCLAALHFFAGCRMASIKRIGYWQIRTAPPRYLHRFAALGVDSKANVDAEKIDFTPDTAFTDAVLLYQGERYQSGINLSPFVIDYNALTFESGAKICFYRARGLADDSLDFCFLEDNSRVGLSWQGVLRDEAQANEVLFSLENQKAYNLDNAIAQFREARHCILGDAFNFDNL